MIELIKEYFDKNKWQFTQVPSNDIFIFSISGKNGNFQCVAEIIEKEHKFMFYSIFGTNVPEERRNNVLELLNMLNCSFFLGNFEMDYKSGEIRYKTSIFYDSITPNINFIDKLIMTNIVMMDDAIFGITGLVYGEISPSQAFDLIVKSKEIKKA